MWFFLLALAWASPPAPPVDYSKLQELHLCLEDFAPICYHLKRSPGPLEVRENVDKHSEQKITAPEFESRARGIVDKVKTPVAVAPNCAPRLMLKLKYADREMAGYVCRDRYSEQEWTRWSSYFR